MLIKQFRGRSGRRSLLSGRFSSGLALVVCMNLLAISLIRANSFSARHSILRPVRTQMEVISLTQTSGQTLSLEQAKPLTRQLGGGAVHIYQVALTSGQFLQVAVKQSGIDVTVRVMGPDDKNIVETDSLFGAEGPEEVSIVADLAGTYRIEVGSYDKNAEAGAYTIEIKELRTAIEKDRDRVAAESLFVEATMMFGQQPTETAQKAIEKFGQARMIFESLHDQAGLARTFYSLSMIYHHLGEGQKEIDCFLRALPIWEAMDYKLMAANTLDGIGVVYSNTGEMRKSIEAFAHELSYAEAMADLTKQARAVNNMAIVHYAIGENQKALSFYSRAFQIVQATGNNQGQAAVLSNMGRVYDDSGEKQKALEAYNKSLELCKLAKDRRTQSRTLRHIGSLYFSLGEHQKALDKFQEAYALHDILKDNLGKALSLNKIGLVYNFYGDTQKALECYEKALTLIKLAPTPRGEGYIVTNIGAIYSARREYQKALDYYNQAISLFQTSVDPLGEAYTRNNIGQVYINLRDEQKALDHLSKALSINRAAGYKGGEAYGHYLIAQVSRNQGNFDEALAKIDAALETVETLRARIDANELRESYFESVQDYYNFKIDLLMQRDKIDPSKRYAAAAFETSERARARSLLEILAEARVDIREGIDPALLERQQTLQQSLNALASGRQRPGLKGKQSPEQAAFVTREIERLTIAYQDLKAQIRKRNPRYAEFTQPQPLSLTDIQARVLDDDTMLLEYSLGRERSYLWTVTKRAINSFELPGRNEIEAAARQLYALLTERNRPSIRFETDEERQERIKVADGKVFEAATTLSRMVLQPVASRLTNKRLLIVADGALQYIPFAMMTSATRPGPKTGYLPLVVEHEIVSLPSASTLVVLRRDLEGRAPARKALAVLADPVFSKEDTRLGNQKVHGQTNPNLTQAPVKDSVLERDLERAARDTEVRDGKFERLIFTRMEAEAILASLPPAEYKVALDFDASRATVTSGGLSEYRIAHFATHGFLDDLHPELSGIVLSLVNREGAEQDGFLRAIDIFNLKLPAELVVLSGCKTGLGKDIRGEGLVGLTRAFMYAGAARVMVSLWSVNDKATAELMTKFYKAMFGQKPIQPAAALRAAQVETWKENPGRSPYYWAPFVLQGEMR